MPRLAAALLGPILALSACHPRAVSPDEAGHLSRPLHVLMINGGGNKAQNYQSHLLHVQQLYDVLRRAGVGRERIAIFSGDGANAAADLAMREVQPEADFWLVRGTRLGRALATPVTYGNSEVPGAALEPATKAALRAWFEAARKRLRPGDVLLLYVTDHGTKNAEDTSNNLITLWGEKETLTVRELGELLALLDPGVRVVTLMSQCFSGAFANLMAGRETTCGYFSSTPDRPAYGCYPENRGKDNVGHSFHFIHALETTRRFVDAHADVLVTDRTPDVPLRTSDVYLEQLLERVARERGEGRTALIDGLLREAWRDKAAWEPDIRLLDRIARSFGIFSPRSLAELDAQSKGLSDLSDHLGKQEDAWKAALQDLAETNLGRFLAAEPEWAKRTDPTILAALDGPGTRALTGALLADLGDYTRAQGTVDGRLRLLKTKGEKAAPAAYRMEVRLGAVLRLRALLAGIAGRVHLATHATAAERATYDSLRACEDLQLAPASAPPATTLAAPAEPFPPYEEDVALAADILPAWLGINFRQANQKRRATLNLPEGAVAVLTVYPDSPAKAAGIEVGDIVLGPPGQHFTEPHQIREWTMLSRIDRPADLDVVHGERRIVRTVRLKPYPLRWPELPGPPQSGSPAPPLKLGAYRGTVPSKLASGKSHLLFFWATWCAPCKASLPELAAFEQQRGAVIAITDEQSDQLDAFFKRHQGPFPAIVATDEFRTAFQAYGVGGTPTFVLIDAQGRVVNQSTGYRADKGLEIDGWTWAGRKAN
jgi:thiol-disulfide isomerase/thioredoxin